LADNPGDDFFGVLTWQSEWPCYKRHGQTFG
jgi:hypothetical protein